MVASQQKKIEREFALVCHQQTHSLDSLVTAIDVIAKKHIRVGGRGISAKLEHSQDVSILSMHIACTNINGRIRMDMWFTQIIASILVDAPTMLMGASNSSKAGCDMKIF